MVFMRLQQTESLGVVNGNVPALESDNLKFSDSPFRISAPCHLKMVRWLQIAEIVLNFYKDSNMLFVDVYYAYLI